MLTCSGLQSGANSKIRNRFTDELLVKHSLSTLVLIRRDSRPQSHGLGSASPETSACDLAFPLHAGIASASSVSATAGKVDRTVRSGSRSRSRTTVSLSGLSPWWSAITPAKYSPKNTKETETIFTKALGAPNFVAKRGIALMISTVTQPAKADAAKNFQIMANIGPIPSPIGFPAYQKPGNIRRK